jgi:hypothetical protein
MANLIPTDTPPVQPSEDVLGKLRRDLHQACDAGGVANVPSRMMRSAPLVFWYGKEPAAAIPGLLDEFVTRTMQSGQPHPRWLRTLIEAWLHDFAPNRIRHPEAGRAISTMLSRCSDESSLVFWRRANQEYAIFDAAEGPRRVGRALLEGKQQPSEILERTGLNEPLRAVGGFYRHAISELLNALPRALQSQHASQAWERAAGLLETTVTEHRKGRPIERPGLRFRDWAGQTADAALSPWLPGAQGSAVPRETVKAFLLRTMDDPRVPPHQWMSASSTSIALMCSWLASDSLEAFLSLISKTNDGNRWKDRQAFWRACLRKAASPEVWIILGPTLADRAHFVRDLHFSYGKMSSAQNATRQAVLLMRINNIILSEWSDIGPIRAWPRGHKLCPKLYQPSYQSGELTTSCLSFEVNALQKEPFTGKGLPHNGSETYLWQDRAAAFLLRQTGIELDRSDYKRR